MSLMCNSRRNSGDAAKVEKTEDATDTTTKRGGHFVCDGLAIGGTTTVDETGYGPRIHRF